MVQFCVKKQLLEGFLDGSRSRFQELLPMRSSEVYGQRADFEEDFCCESFTQHSYPSLQANLVVIHTSELLKM